MKRRRETMWESAHRETGQLSQEHWRDIARELHFEGKLKIEDRGIGSILTEVVPGNEEDLPYFE